ncbi:unnamed protein product [Cuscuta epithymum]|uniref:Uncharacterized protein n=1 Tax=Cuscuta epithymum TaxID=186058 RepID=A0AAV0D4G1_9ASTE|nr:unnamed protein product [Cuscuta epithymum]
MSDGINKEETRRKSGSATSSKAATALNFLSMVSSSSTDLPPRDCRLTLFNFRAPPPLFRQGAASLLQGSLTRLWYERGACVCQLSTANIKEIQSNFGNTEKYGLI